jgi:hypothetical protein
MNEFSKKKIDFVEVGFRFSCECSVVCGLLLSVDDSKKCSVVLCGGRCLEDSSTTLTPIKLYYPPCNKMQYRCVLLSAAALASVLVQCSFLKSAE